MYIKKNWGNIEYWAYLNLVVFVIYDVLQAPIKYYTSNLGGDLLYYVLKVGLLIVSFWKFRIFSNKYSKVFLLFLFFEFIYSTLVNGDVLTGLLFIPVIIPLIFALSYPSVIIRLFQNNILMWFLLLISLLGVLFELNFSVPWSGYSTIVNGYEVEVSRQWSYNGIRRISGFSRSSYELASWSCIFSICLLRNFNYKFILSIIVFSLTTFIIYQSTTKILLVSFFIVFFFYSLVPRLIDIKYRIDFFSIFIVVSIGVLFPLLSILDYIGNIPNVSFLDSLYIRVNFTWPDAFSLIDNSILYSLFGLGIGGIGSVQAKFGSFNYNPGDNFFVYTYCSIGLVSFLIYAYIIKLSYLSSGVGKYDRSTLMLCMLFGITANLVESPGFIMLLCFSIFTLSNFQENNKNDYS
jgi:hypothetical protein